MLQRKRNASVSLGAKVRKEEEKQDTEVSVLSGGSRSSKQNDWSRKEGISGMKAADVVTERPRGSG